MGRALTRAQVEEARTRHFVGEESFARLARVFGVSRATITKAVKGETYADVLPTYRRSKTPDPKGTP